MNSGEIISDDETMGQVVAEHERRLDLVIVAYREMRDRDQAAGVAATPDAALGGVVMIMSEGFSPASLRLLASVAVRRLADAEVVTR